MATWKKVIVSGSNAELNQITSSGGLNAVLPSSQQPNYVSYNPTTGQLGYFGTGSLTAATASFITASNVYGPFGSNSVISASVAVSASVTSVTDTTTGVGPYYITFKDATTGFPVDRVDSTGLTYNATANAITATASFAGTASFATSASFAVSASNAALLNGQAASFYQNASNINAGTLGNAFLPAAINVTSVSASFTGSLTGALIGTASWATNATTATNATNATNTAITDTTTGTGPYYVTFVDATTGNAAQRVDSTGLTYNATTNTLTVTSSFAGTSSFAASSSFATSASYAASVNNLTNAITNNTNNNILTATGGGTINGESNLTFDGSLLTVTGNAVITNNLTVQGTASFQQTTNLEVADRFVLLASGSNTTGDGGLVIQQSTQNVGELFGYENSINRWGFTSSFTANNPTFTAAAFVTTTEVGTTAPPTAPIYGGSGNGLGNIYVRSSTEEIFIYS